MKKAISVLLVLMMILGVTMQATAESNAKTEIQFWHHHSGGTAENLETMVNRYNELPESKAHVTLQYLPKNELLKRYALGVISGDLPEVALVDNPDTLSFAAMGMYIDITDRVATLENPNFLEQSLNSGNYKGVQYTLPIRSNCLALWLNNDMLEAAGVTSQPTTWDELLDVCAKLKAANPNVYPLAFSAIKTEEAVFQLMPFLISAGASWDTMDSPEAVEAFEFIKTLSDNGYISMEVINWSQNDVEKQFAAGNSAMMINGQWQLPNITKDAPDLKYTIINIPKNKEFASTLGGENIGITKVAVGKEDIVWDFFSWIVSLDASVEYNKMCGTLSPNADATKEMQYPDNNVMSAFMEQIQYAKARGPHPKWPEISSAIQDCIQETLTGAKLPAQATKDAGAKIKAIDASIQ